MTGSGPLLGEDRPHPACDECGQPLDPDVAHICHSAYCEPNSPHGCYCPEVCASCCQDPDCPVRQIPGQLTPKETQ